MSVQQHTPAAIYPQDRPSTHFTVGWVGPQGQSGQAENLIPTEIQSRTVQPVVSGWKWWVRKYIT